MSNRFRTENPSFCSRTGIPDCKWNVSLARFLSAAPNRRGYGAMIVGEPVLGRQLVCDSSKRDAPHGG
jgi:hypothetical protein